MNNPEMTRFFHNSLEHLVNPFICLLQVGWERCTPKYQYTNYRNFYLVHFIRSGKGTLQIDGHTYELSANDTFLIRPNQLAVYTADENSPWEYYYFAFSGEMAASLIQRSCFQNNNSTYQLEDDTLYHYIKEAALDLSHCESSSDIRGLEHLFKFMGILMPLSQDTGISLKDDSTSSSEQVFSSVQEYLQFNYFKPIQINDICKNINISRSYLFRIFKKYADTSVEEYLLKLRIQHAKKLLATTDFPTTSIANLVGYTNLSSFYRMFKRIEHVTPSEWRELHKKLISKNKNGSIQEHSEN